MSGSVVGQAVRRTGRRLLRVGLPSLLLLAWLVLALVQASPSSGPVGTPVGSVPARATPAGTVPSPSASVAPTFSPPALPSTVSPTSQSAATPLAIPTAAPTLPLPTSGEVVLGAENTDRLQLQPGVLLHPHGLAVISDTAYLLDAGELAAVPLQGTEVRRLCPPDGRVDTLPVGELITMALGPDGVSLVLLDKRGDLYRYDPAADRWSVERAMDRRRTSPNPVFVAVASYNERSYLLDESYSQVWRHPYGAGVAEGVFSGSSGANLTRAIDLAVYRDLFVLLREGRQEAAGLLRFSGSPAVRVGSFAAGLELDRPTRLHLTPGESGPLYVIDLEGHRLRALDRESGAVLLTYTYDDDALEIRAVSAWGDRLVLSSPDALLLYPGSGQVMALSGGEGPDAAGRPDAPQRLAALPALELPIDGLRFLPDQDSLLPGSPRVYRFGIHRGLDMYGGTMGVAIPYGTPVRAVADGVVIRADHHFEEMTPAEWSTALGRCIQLHETPPEILDRLRGRQVWLDHGDGLVTRYVHLAGIPEEVLTGTVVAAGQLIGYAGNSGTSAGVEGSQQGTHLHFELYMDGHYLGEGLSTIEVRRLLQRLFFP